MLVIITLIQLHYYNITYKLIRFVIDKDKKKS